MPGNHKCEAGHLTQQKKKKKQKNYSNKDDIHWKLMMWKIEKLPAVRGETRFGSLLDTQIPRRIPSKTNIREMYVCPADRTHSKDALPFCGLNKGIKQ